ncbi:MAG: 3-deoxy-D-manno-octulosonic acid transferase [Oceanicaulis sp.]
MSPPGLFLYRVATRVAAPLAGPLLQRRAERGKEDPARLAERRGEAGLSRPAGVLIWLHAASVGESMIALSLAEALGEIRPDAHFLITSGTRTSAGLVARRGAPRVLHQYPPVDRPGWAKRFIEHWRPDLAVFTESELWPNLIEAAHRSGAKLALVNARLNDASLKGWGRWPASARTLLSRFDWIGAADARTAQGLSTLRGEPVKQLGNLKLETGLPDPDPAELAAARKALAGRPVFVAASTHSGEEAILAEAHRHILKEKPDALMILAPRHPERAGEAEAALANAGLSWALRSAGGAPAADTQVWLADTLGEMGLWFSLSPAAVIGGSYVDGIGGHNPIEATRAGATVISGPYTASFDDVFAAYDAEMARTVCSNAAETARAVLQIWSGEGPTAAAAERAVATLSGGAVGATLDALTALLEART